MTEQNRRVNGKELLILTSFFLALILFLNFTNAAVIIVRPVNSSNSTGTALFNVSYVNATDLTDAVNASFYYNNSAGVWTLINSTTSCIKSATVASCNATLNIVGVLEGRYTINATLANTTTFAKSASVLSYNVTLDSTAPNVSTFYDVVNNGNYSGVKILNVSISDGGVYGVSSVYFNITYPNGTQINFTKATASGVYYNLTINTSVFVDGWYNITVYANDSVLNNLNSTEKIYVLFDNVAPTGTFSCSPSHPIEEETITCSCDMSDVTSGIFSRAYTEHPSSEETGTFTQTCIVYDYANNSANFSTTYTIQNQPGASSTTPTTSSNTVTTETPVTKSQSFTEVTPAAPVTITGFASGTGMSEIKLEVSEIANNIRLIVEKYDAKPTNVSTAKTDSYKYLHIEASNLTGKLSKATMIIKVEKSWMAGKSLNQSEVALFRFDETGNTWNKLTTTFKEEDSTYNYYTVELDHFSYFSIAASKEAVQSADEEEGQVETLGNEEENQTPFNMPLWGWIITAVVAVAIIGFVGFTLVKKKK